LGGIAGLTIALSLSIPAGPMVLIGIGVACGGVIMALPVF